MRGATGQLPPTLLNLRLRHHFWLNNESRNSFVCRILSSFILNEQNWWVLCGNPSKHGLNSSRSLRIWIRYNESKIRYKESKIRYNESNFQDSLERVWVVSEHCRAIYAAYGCWGWSRTTLRTMDIDFWPVMVINARFVITNLGFVITNPGFVITNLKLRVG